MNDSEFEATIEEMFNRERLSLRAPAGLRARVSSAIGGAAQREQMGGWALRPAFAGAFAVLVAGIVSVTAALLLFGGSSDPTVEPGTVHEPGPPVPQVGEEPLLVRDTGVFLEVRSNTFERGPAALEAAEEIIPYPLDLPSYVPQGLRVSHLGAQVPKDAPQRATMSVAYTLPPDGTWRPELGISWIGSDQNEPYPLREHNLGEAFEASGYEWRTHLYNWRDGDSWEAVTTRDDGVRVFVSLRVAGGLDRNETLAELKKVVESMGAGAP